MAPADSKDWLFAAVALTTATTAAPAMAEGQKAGVVTGVVASTRAFSDTPTDVAAVVLGDNVRAGEHLRTGPNGIIHILFLDQSSITLGADSRLTVDSFSHDTAVRSGKISMTLHEGSVRVVGGMNSKTNETEVHTAGGTVGILGGISIVESRGPSTVATFLFGQQMRLTDQSGKTETVLRPGFSLTSTQSGVYPPQITPQQQLSSLTQGFERGRDGSAPGPQSSPSTPPSAPSASLISTSDRPIGQSAPTSSLAADRLGNPGSALVGAAMGNNRPGAVAGSDTPPSPVNAVRTNPPVATS